MTLRTTDVHTRPSQPSSPKPYLLLEMIQYTRAIYTREGQNTISHEIGSPFTWNPEKNLKQFVLSMIIWLCVSFFVCLFVLLLITNLTSFHCDKRYILIQFLFLIKIPQQLYFAFCILVPSMHHRCFIIKIACNFSRSYAHTIVFYLS